MPRKPGLRIVLDTNCLLRGLAKPDSAAGNILDLIDSAHALLLTSPRVIQEYRIILNDPGIIARHPTLSATSVEFSLRRLIYYSEQFKQIRTRFSFPRDPKDEKFLLLSIEGKASHLITFDEDLLQLAVGHDDAAKRLRQRAPNLRIQTPAEFLAENSRRS